MRSVLVAAVDAPDVDKRIAWRVCDGVDDQVEIREAVEYLSGSGVVHLSKGTFCEATHMNLRSTR